MSNEHMVTCKACGREHVLSLKSGLLMAHKSLTTGKLCRYMLVLTPAQQRNR